MTYDDSGDQELTDTITVYGHNAAKLKVDADHSTLSALSDHFAYRPKGYQFTPTFKNKVWDGYIRLFDTRSKTLPVGLLPRMIKFARDYDVAIDTSNYTTENARFDVKREEIEAFAAQLNVHSDGNKITPRDYQIDAVYYALTEGRMVALAPTSAGKSLILYIYMRYMLEHNPEGKILLIVPSTGLVHQMLGDFLDYQTGPDGECVYDDMGDHCHIIMAGKKKFSDKRIYISTWQSLQDMAKNKDHAYFQQFSVVAVDEVHGAKSKTVTSILDLCANAHFRLGLTGTLDGTELMQIALEGLFGKVIQITTTKELMDRGEIAQLDIKMVMLEHQERVKKMFTKMPYPSEMAYITQLETRNKFIAKLATRCNGNTLILVEKVETHGKLIYDQIESILGQGSQRKLYFIHGGIDGKDRDAIKKLIEKEDDAIIVATYGCLSTGVSIKRLHNVIFGSPSKSQIRVLQSLGRGLRLGNNKNACVLFDIADDIGWKKHKNHTLLHAIERIKIYASQKFNYKLSKVKLP